MKLNGITLALAAFFIAHACAAALTGLPATGKCKCNL